MIEAAKDAERHALTQAQMRIWYEEKMVPGTGIHNIGGWAAIKGPVDWDLLERAIRHSVAANPGLCLQVEDGEVPMQYVSREQPAVAFLDFSGEAEPETSFRKWVEERKKTAFLLDGHPLYELAMFTLGKQDNGFFVKLHHLIADGWSFKILSEQIRDAYLALLNGEELPVSPAQSFLDLVEQEQAYLASDRFLKSRAFWHDKFKMLPESLVPDRSESLEGHRKSFVMEPEELRLLRGFLQKSGITMNTFFTALFLLYLYKTTGQNDLVLGVPVFNRTGKKEKGTIGMMTSTMPFRLQIESDATFAELAVKTSQELKSSFKHQKYPFNLLVQELELRKKGVDRLFQHCVNYYNTKLVNDYDGLQVENTEFYNGHQFYSLQLVIREWSDVGRLSLDFDYKADEFSAGEIDRMHAELLQLMKQVLQQEDQPVRTLSLLTEQEREDLLIKWNETEQPFPADKTIVHLFEEQAARTPEKTALRFGGQTLSYKQLNEKANRLARTLAGDGVAPDAVAGILATPSFEMIIAILGVLKAGGAYVPIDPEYPQERIRYLLSDSSARLLLTNTDVPEDLDWNGKVLDLEDERLYQAEGGDLKTPAKPHHLAYMIYTSGTTGQPKGVMIEHRGLVNYIVWAVGRYLPDAEEVMGLFTSFSFDLTVTTIFAPLVTGNQIAIYREQEDDEYVLYRIMRENIVTVLKLTPSHLALLADLDLRQSSVRRLIVGGEDLKVQTAARIRECFGGRVEICNEYGPTEAVVGCMIHAYEEGRDNGASVPIGVPIANTKLYVLDRDLNPVPPGRRGELYVSSEGLARGYRNKPDLTHERFLDNPFAPGTRMYKTGDLASYQGGVLAYHGRIDEQVKVRGYRIELAEIEHALLSIGGIEEAVAMVREDAAGQSQLVAYLVTYGEVTDEEVRRELSKSLPHYMIPAHYVEMERLPLTVNGKVDRRMLPAPAWRTRTEASGSRTEQEAVLFSIIESVLQIDSAGADENFYHLGGDSIKAIQVAAKLQDSGYKLPVKTILQHPVLGEMAAFLERDEKAGAISQEACTGVVPNTPILSWFLAQNFAEPHHYNQSVLLDIRQERLDAAQLGAWLDQLVTQHDTLRLNYDEERKQLFYNDAHLRNGHQAASVDLSGLPVSEQDAQLRVQGEQIKASMDLKAGLLFKACLFDLGARGKRLLLTAHHLVVDGVSWRIILQHLGEFLQGGGVNRPKTHSFQAWANLLHEEAADLFAEEANYWGAAAESDFEYPADFPNGSTADDECATVVKSLDAERTSLLVKEANRAYHTQPHELLVIALAMTLHEQTGRKDIVLELESHGRDESLEQLNLSQTVGWFTSLYPVRLTLDQGDMTGRIKSLKEQLKQTPRLGIGYGVLKYLSGLWEETDAKQPVRLNYLGDFDNAFASDVMTLAAEESGTESSSRNRMTSLLDLNAMIVDRKLEIRVTYSTSRFRDETAAALLARYVEQLQAVIEHCCAKEGIEFTPSDFETIDLSQGELDGLF